MDCAQWLKENANIKNFAATPAALVFHLSVGAILVLYVQFWLHLVRFERHFCHCRHRYALWQNMFQTLQWLLLLGPVAIVSGKFALKSIAEKVYLHFNVVVSLTSVLQRAKSA